MKNTKKSVILAALAVVFLAMALVIGCTSPVDGALGMGDEPSAPGTGKAKLSINSRNASRTIKPTALPSNLKYFVTFVGDGASLADYSDSVTGTGIISGIPEGTYTDIKVIVYTSASHETSLTNVTPLAIGEGSYSGSATLNIDASTPLDLTGTGDEINTTLYTPGTATGNGSFQYTITKNASRLATATFDIKNRSGGATADSGTVTFGSAQTITDIPSGYYNVIYTLTDNTPTTPNVAYFYEILHVYKNMTSVFTRTFTNDIFPAISGTGNGSIVINPPGTNTTTITASLTTTSAASVTISSTSYGWNVAIKKNATAANLTFEVTAPATGVTFGNWNKLPALTPIPAGDGITLPTPSGQTKIITIDATDPNFPLAKDGSFNYTQLELSYIGESYSPPAINIQFVD
jgi:hypothetical protein